MRTRTLAGSVAVTLAVLAAQAHGGDEQFRSCLGALEQEAKDRGIAADVVEPRLRAVEFQSRVIELDRSQPEFVATFAEYFHGRVTEERVERGRELLEQHADLLREIYREYGVPPRYLVAFWGIETHYGSYFGRMPVIDSLATLACDKRRSRFFTEELMDALRIIEQDALGARPLEGSWAGAMGHVQFLPSVFMRYAVDHDGDGRRDLWDSLPDAMASAANFLRALGWETGWRWGREVTLPDGFPYELAGNDQWRTLAEWRELDVRDAYGRKLANVETEAALLIPAGHEGPAFLVYPNFNVIMRWNRSEYYAVAVGRLADRLAGAASLRNPPPDVPRLRREQIAALQQRLNEKGFDSGAVDGVPGPATRQAIRRFQQTRGMIADGYPSPDVIAELAPETLDVEEEG